MSRRKARVRARGPNQSSKQRPHLTSVDRYERVDLHLAKPWLRNSKAASRSLEERPGRLQPPKSAPVSIQAAIKCPINFVLYWPNRPSSLLTNCRQTANPFQAT